MPPSISIIIVAVFLLVGIIPLYTMLTVQGGKKVENPKAYIFIHKVTGYIFTLLFLVMFVDMIIRVKEYWEESSPRIAIHVVLAVVLFFILMLKILIPRFFKRLSGYMFVLGIAVYAMAFSLVMITGGYYLIWRADKQQVQPADEHLADLNLGRSLFIEKCSTCHDLKSIMRSRTESEWTRIVGQMVELAAPRITADEGNLIVSYLVKAHSPAPVSAKLDASMVEKHCYPCHKPSEIFNAKRTKAEWMEILKQMNKNDPKLVPLDMLDEISDYLVKTQESEPPVGSPVSK